MSLEELDEKEMLRRNLQELCRDAITKHELQKNDRFDRTSVGVKCFGSLSNGFATKSSDMDLAVVSPNSIPDTSSKASEIPRMLEKALLDAGFGARLLTRTRVPIIKFCEKPTPEFAAVLLEARAKWEIEGDPPCTPVRKIMGADHNQKLDGKPGLDTNGGSGNPVSFNGSTDPEFKKGELSEPATAEDSQDTNIGVITTRSISLDSRGNIEGTRGTRSDEELVFLYKLAMSEGWYDAGERILINNFLHAVEHHEPGSDAITLNNARSALDSLTDLFFRYRPPVENPLDFPKTGVGIQCDINFSNPLALHNTRLMRCYTLCDPRVRPMVIFVKTWAKQRKINNPYHGTLSSYGYVLMVLHYLANVVDPPIIPNLQTTRKASHDKSPENLTLVNGYNVRFWRSEDEIKDLAERKMLTRNREDGLGILLCGFFHYYAHQNQYTPGGGFCWSMDVLSLRTPGGLLKKQAKDWTGAKNVPVDPSAPDNESREIRHRFLLAIEDPFEIDHNIARTVVHHGIVAIRDEFRRAISIIQSVGPGGLDVLQELIVEAKEKPMQRRAFGPLPWVDPAEYRSRKQDLIPSKEGKFVLRENQNAGRAESKYAVKRKPKQEATATSSQSMLNDSSAPQPVSRPAGRKSRGHTNNPSLSSHGKSLSIDRFQQKLSLMTLNPQTRDEDASNSREPPNQGDVTASSNQVASSKVDDNASTETKTETETETETGTVE